MAEAREAQVRRARGDGWVAVSPLVAGVGAVAGGTLALIAVGGRMAQVVEQWARAGTQGVGAAEALPAALLALVGPVLAGAWVGAVGAGLIQTRALLAWGGARTPMERERAPVVLRALLALGLAVLVVHGARQLLYALAGGAAPVAALAAAASAALPRMLLWCLAAGLVELGWRRARLMAALLAEPSERDGPGPQMAAERRRRMR